MDYLSTFLSFNPGPAFADILGNEINSTFDPAAVKGIASPIETDPSSRAVRFVVGKIPGGGLMNLVNDYTWVVRGFYEGSGGQTNHLISRRGQFGLSHTVQCGFNIGSIVATVTLTNGLFYQIVADIPAIPNNWYMLAVEAEDGGEERNGQSDKTRRRYTYDIPIMDSHSRRRLKAFLRNHRGQPVIWPTVTYETELDAVVSPGSNVIIPVDTEFMDYDIGGRAILSTSETESETIEIVGMTADSVTAKSVQREWPAGTTIRPAKRAIVQQDISLTSITDDTQDMTLTATILVEDIAIAPNRITPYTPTLYRGVEIFNPFEFGLNDTSEPSDDDSHLVAEIMDTGQGIFRLNTDQEFAKEGIGYTFFLDGRELISKWLGWFERRAGRLNNLWVPTMVRDIGELVDISLFDNTITLSESHYEADYLNDPARGDLVLIGLDETLGFRHITGLSAEDDNEVLTLNPFPTPYTIDNTEFVCFALMCRLDADEVELAWFTNDMLKATVKFREVPKEAS